MTFWFFIQLPCTMVSCCEGTSSADEGSSKNEKKRLIGSCKMVNEFVIYIRNGFH